MPPADFAGLKALVADADARLAVIDPAELEGLIGQNMRFEFKGRRLDSTTDGLLLSFSQPDCHVHASAACALLRAPAGGTSGDRQA